MTGVPDDRVEAALEELLGWPAIARSPQLARFLSYIVLAKLRGEDAGIKAYSIAVDVFGRPATFDPQSDPIVRVQARRLRALLDRFYDEGNGKAGARIHLPVGRYVPEFTEIDVKDGPQAKQSASEDRDLLLEESAPQVGARGRAIPLRLMIGVLGVAAAVAIGVGVLVSNPTPPVPPAAIAPSEPEVLVGRFSNLSGMSDLDGFGRELAEAVRADLAPFEDIRVRLDDPERPASGTPPEGAYLLSGIIHTAQSGMEVTATLLGTGGDSIWNATYAHALPAAGETAGIVASVARSIARELGPFRGPVHARGRAWLDEQGRPLPAVSNYVCLLTYRLARESGGSNNIADALSCTERLLREQPDAPLALSSQAWLTTRAALNQTLPLGLGAGELDAALSQTERALGIAPGSSLVHEHLGSIRNWQDRFDASEKDYVAALQFNPLNIDARAGYAITLGRAMKWVLGGEQASLAVADTPYPSPWYFYPIGVNALREGRHEEALEAGRRAIRFAGGEMGTVIALAAAQSLGRQEVIDELLPRLLSMESLRRGGVMPWFAAQVSDPAILAQIAVALGKAGVPADALTAAF